MDRITLDRDTFKALASDTRLDILKALDERQKTVTELAKQLDLDKSTVFEHLEKLAAPNVGLIQKLEDERSDGSSSEDAPQRVRKWVYWQLTWKGRRLLHPEAITLALVLSTAAASFVTAIFAAWSWLRSNVAPAPEAADAAQPSIMARSVEDAPTAPPVEHDPVLMAVWIGFAVLCFALLVAAWVVRARAAKKRAAGAIA